MFEDKAMVLCLDNLTPSPVRSLRFDVVNPDPNEKVWSTMQDVIKQSVSLLPPEYQERFKLFGKMAENAKQPLTLTTLCSGTDGAVDVMKDWFFNEKQKTTGGRLI